MAPAPRRESIVTASSVLFYFHVCAITLFLFFVLCHLYRLTVDFGWKGQRDGLRSLTWLFLPSAVMCLLTTPLSLAADGFDWRGHDAQCAAVYPTITVTFVFSKVFTYDFLWVRAAIVHDSLQLVSTRARWLRMGTLVVVNSAPLVIVPICISYVGSKVVAEGPCVFYATSIVPFIFFAVCDFFLNILLLLLFLVPLLMRMKSVRDSRLDAIIRFNFAVSVLCAVSTLLAFMATAILVTLAIGPSPPPPDEVYQIYSVYPPSIDAVVCIVAVHSLTKIWMPRPLVGFVRRAALWRFTWTSSSHHQSHPPNNVIAVQHRRIETLPVDTSFVATSNGSAAA